MLYGEEWELIFKFKFTNRCVRICMGSNTYLPYWKKLKEAFRPFLKRPDDPLSGSDMQAGK